MVPLDALRGGAHAPVPRAGLPGLCRFFSRLTITFERPASVARPCGNMGHQVGGPGGAALHGGYYPIID
jgi:hypothetical protein